MKYASPFVDEIFWVLELWKLSMLSDKQELWGCTAELKDSKQNQDGAYISTLAQWVELVENQDRSQCYAKDILGIFGQFYKHMKRAWDKLCYVSAM